MPVPMVVTARRDSKVTLPKASLPDDIRRHPRIAGVREITVAGPADESPVPRRIEPSDSLAVSDHWGRRGLRLVSATPTASTVTPMTPSVAIVLVLTLVPLKVLPAALILTLVI
jgi:hypothetical protein